MTGTPSQFPFEKHVHGGCANAPVLRESSILELLTLGGEGASELLIELVDLYLEDSAVRMAEAQGGFQDQDPEQVSRAVHALKSSSANMGAIELSQLCANLEAVGSGEELTPELLAKLEGMHAEVQAALRELRASYSA